jgi:hypothetical protein
MKVRTVHRICLYFAAIAVLLSAAPASSPAAERANTNSVVLEENWEPCFNDRPADRIVAMRGMGEMDELLKQMLKLGGPILAAMADDAVGDMNVMEIIPEEFIALLYGEKMNRALGDIESVANHGCGAAQAMISVYSRMGLGRIRTDWLESLKWMMLAEKYGFAPAQETLKKMMPVYSTEEITEARAWVGAWRPSD